MKIWGKAMFDTGEYFKVKKDFNMSYKHPIYDAVYTEKCRYDTLVSKRHVFDVREMAKKNGIDPEDIMREYFEPLDTPEKVQSEIRRVCADKKPGWYPRTLDSAADAVEQFVIDLMNIDDFMEDYCEMCGIDDVYVFADDVVYDELLERCNSADLSKVGYHLYEYHEKDEDPGDGIW